MIPCPSTLDVAHELVEPVSCLIYARRRELRSRWRKLVCFKQALLAPAHLRKNETLAVGSGVSDGGPNEAVCTITLSGETIDAVSRTAHEAAVVPMGSTKGDGTKKRHYAEVEEIDRTGGGRGAGARASGELR